MAQFTDEELLFLCNLMHIKKENEFQGGFKDIWVKEYKKDTLGTLLQDYLTEENIEEMRKSDYVYDGEISSAEWAQMLQTINDDAEAARESGEVSLLDLKVIDINRDDANALTVCLADSEGNAYVVFRGTAAGEWPDNFIAGFQADTNQQRRALEFVENLPYENITVVGHSKGGNKAKYVALLSDKVSRCVSFDGQGFSVEFYNKYSDLVEKNAHKIANYALDGDFVNILLPDVNVDEKKYVKGYGVDVFAQNHSPNSFFHFDEQGGYCFDIGPQMSNREALHEFTNYIVNTISDEDKEVLFSYLGNVADRFMGKKPPEYTEKYSTIEQVSYIFEEENAEALAILLAYVTKYEEYNSDIVDAICEILGENVIKDGIQIVDDSIGVENVLKVVNIRMMLEGLRDSILYLKKTYFFDLTSQAKKYYDQLPDVGSNIGDYQISMIIRDFSQEMREELMTKCNQIEQEAFYDINWWDTAYGGEPWMRRLSIASYQSGINNYYDNVHEINTRTKETLTKIFEEVDTADYEYAQKMKEKNEILAELAKAISEI